MDGFFILSGFLITRSWFSARSTGDYLLRRVLRIYPGFLVAVIFSGLIAAPWLAESSEAFWKAFSWRGFFVGGARLILKIPSSQVEVNGSLWTIPYEFKCYLAIVGFGLCGGLTRRFWVLLALFLCMGLYAGQVYGGWVMPESRLNWLIGYPGFWPRAMSDFLAGTAFYCYRDRIVLSRPLFLGALLGLFLFGVAAPSLRLLPLLIPILGGYVLLYASYVPMGRLQHFSRHGDLSYGLYLYAFPIQQLLIASWGRWLHPLGLFVVAWGITAVFAALSWHLVERPFMRLKRSSRPRQDRPELAGDVALDPVVAISA